MYFSSSYPHIKFDCLPCIQGSTSRPVGRRPDDLEVKPCYREDSENLLSSNEADHAQHIIGSVLILQDIHILTYIYTDKLAKSHDAGVGQIHHSHQARDRKGGVSTPKSQHSQSLLFIEYVTWL